FDNLPIVIYLEIIQSAELKTIRISNSDFTPYNMKNLSLFPAVKFTPFESNNKSIWVMFIQIEYKYRQFSPELSIDRSCGGLYAKLTFPGWRVPFSGDHHYHLSFERIAIFQRRTYFTYGSTNIFLVNLGHFPGDTDQAVGSGVLFALHQKFVNAVGRLIYDHGFFPRGKIFPLLVSTFLMREKAGKIEMIRGKT